VNKHCVDVGRDLREISARARVEQRTPGRRWLFGCKSAFELVYFRKNKKEIGFRRQPRLRVQCNDHCTLEDTTTEIIGPESCVGFISGLEALGLLATE
jgi:hypothetical protein